MNGILALILVLFVLLLAVEGKHAVTTFTSLALNALLLIVTIILIAGGFQPIGVALVLGVLGLSITIFMNSQNTKIAGPAFLASMLVLLGLAGLMWVLVTYGVTGGFGDEDGETLEGFSLLIGVSFKQIMIATGIMSALGAVAEVAIAVAAGLTTADLDTPQAQHELTSEIIGTAMNTLFFGFFGGFAALFIWFVRLHYDVSQLLNNKVLVGELFQVLAAMLAVLVTGPLTTWIINRRRRK